MNNQENQENQKSQEQPEGISVVMMGRDEESFLPRTLTPLQQVADEIIFVDTGSQDRSMTLAKEHGCQVFQQPWQDDFSAPKNFAIEQAKFAWILNVDCDEVLMQAEQARRLILAAGKPSTLNQTVATGFIIHIDNLMSNQEVTTSQALRLFRNDPRIRFRNPIHEGVASSLYQHWPHQPPATLEVRLQHYGYQAGSNKEKLARNMTILRKWVEKEPTNIYACFKLGTNLRHRGNSREGLFFLEKSFTLIAQAKDKTSYPFLNNLLTTYYQALLENGLQQKASEMKQTLMSWGSE